MKINQKQLEWALEITTVQEDEDSELDASLAYFEFCEKYGITPITCIIQAATILLQITAPEYVPTKEMNEAGRSKYLEFFDFLPEDVPRPIFRAMITELVEG